MKRISNISGCLSLIIVIMVNSSCNVAQIAANNDKIGRISTIAITPFEKSEGIPASVSTECEESFKDSLIKSGFSVVERKKLDAIFKENELSMVSLKYSDGLVTILGADALLTGQITEFKEESRDIQYMGFDRDELGFEITKKTDPETKKEIQLEKKLIKDREHVLHFKLFLRILSIKTGETLLVMENTLSSDSYTEKGGPNQRSTLTEFKNRMLTHMNEELETYLSKIRKK